MHGAVRDDKFSTCLELEPKRIQKEREREREREIYPPLCFELFMRTKALLLQFRVLFPDICEGLSFWGVAGGCPDKHFGDKRRAP